MIIKGSILSGRASEMDIVNEKLRLLENNILQLEDEREQLLKNFKEIVATTCKQNAQHDFMTLLNEDRTESKNVLKNETAKVVEHAKNMQFQIKKQIKVISDILGVKFSVKSENPCIWDVNFYLNDANKNSFLKVAYDINSNTFQVIEIKTSHADANGCTNFVSEVNSIGKLYHILKMCLEDQRAEPECITDSTNP